ncbi:MAG TPA: hypothetical protein PK402_08805, partial [Tepidisphaeraceae bacterium]|nr:hypothetical protein [Tepidisphaeraceae bacterium]
MLAAVSWDGGGDGTLWSDPLNWSSNVIPTVADDVTLDVPGSPTITVTGATTRYANSLVSRETLLIRSDLRVTNLVTLHAPTTIDSQADFVVGSLTLESTLTFNHGTLYFDAQQSMLDGSGSILTVGYTSVRSVTSLVIGEDIEVSGAFGFNLQGSLIQNYATITTTGTATMGDLNTSLVNHGIMNFGPEANIHTYNLINASDGVVNLNNAFLRMEGFEWTNQGTFVLTDSDILMEGAFTYADIGTFVRTGGSIRFRADIDNQGQPFYLDGIGSVTIDGGLVRNVVFEPSGDAIVRVTRGTLRDITLNAPSMIQSGEIVVIDGLFVLNAPMRLGNGLGNQGELRIDPASWSGTGSIWSSGPEANKLYIPNVIPSWLSITLDDRDWLYTSSPLINNGTLRFVGDGVVDYEAVFSGATSVVNNGTFSVENGMKLSIPMFQNNPTGVATFSDSYVILKSSATNAPSWINNGQFHFINSRVDLQGRFSHPDL